MTTVATIEARMNSKRLPGKVLADIVGTPALGVMVERLKEVPELDGIVIATTTNGIDDAVEALAHRLGVGCWRGNEDDVLQRVLDAATHYGANVIVELTGDCPLIDPAIISTVIERYRSAGVDYVSNTLERTYPIGMDTQVFATRVLADVAGRTMQSEDREHVSLYIYRHPELYSLENVSAPVEYKRPKLRLTLDTAEDLEVIRAVHGALRVSRAGYSLSDMLAFLDDRPHIAAINARVAHRWV